MSVPEARVAGLPTGAVPPRRGQWAGVARRLWPRTLAGRVTLLLIGGLTLLHLGSMAIHERALHGAEAGAQVERLAERLSAAD